jgi:uncharacterized membrane protein YGL010W
VPSLNEYMTQYDHEHTNPWNKVMHAVGIPIVIAGLVLLCITWWRIGLALFVGGWILLCSLPVIGSKEIDQLSFKASSTS